jgi:hypothetical protein
MYRVLGTDEKEYGPVSADVVLRWIREGRANALTKVRVEAGADWRPLGEFPEFAAVFRPGPRPPPLPAQPSVHAAPRERGRPSGLATASLVLGILALPTCGLTSLIGLPLGIVALRKIKRSGGRLTGQGVATAGVCVSGVLFLLLPVMLALLLPIVAREGNQVKMVSCMNNLRQLGVAMRMYANDQSDKFALARNWNDALQGYAGASSAFTCPAGASGRRCHFAYNARLSGLEVDRINPKTVLFFEIEGGWNASGGSDQMLRKPRHFMVNVCYADGTVEQVHASRLPHLRWDP